jgi:hypothetical protein
MIAEFISPQDPRWTRLLMRVPHDFYHLPEYMTFAAEHECGTPTAFYAETGDALFLAPLLIQKIPASLGAPEDWCDATTPYGYPTPIVIPPNSSSFLKRFLEVFREVGTQYGIVTAFFRLHPLLTLPKEALIKYGMLMKHGQTVYIDLLLSLEDLWAQTRHGHRGDIRKLVRSGFHVKMDDWSLFKDFIGVYERTMKRVSANRFYAFSDRYFADLRSTLGDRLHLCVVLSPGGEVASAGLFTVTNGVVQYHLSGTSDEYICQAPSKLMLDFVCRWAKETRNVVFHLGGGVGGHLDSLFEFKAGFSKLRADFYTYRVILDASRYVTLTNLWRDQCGNVNNNSSNFFPAYRNSCVQG